MLQAEKWDQRFMELAAHVATWSKDPSTKTGAVIVRHDRTIAAVGYNGFPRGMSDYPHWYEDRNTKLSRIIHCEMNAIMSCQDANHSGYTLYTFPFSSCDRCFVHMVQWGIVRFVYNEPMKWEGDFEKVKQYAKEMGVGLCELDIFNSKST